MNRVSPFIGAFFTRFASASHIYVTSKGRLMNKERRFRFYRNQPVKHMRRDGEDIVLTFVSYQKGEPGRQKRITQADWKANGCWKPVASTRMDDLRALVAR